MTVKELLEKYGTASISLTIRQLGRVLKDADSATPYVLNLLDEMSQDLESALKDAAKK